MSYNFPEQEKEILKFWSDNKIFEKLKKKNKGGNPSTRSARSGQDRWSFLDGPITANNPMGVHHAWGRTYKDLLQRYFAMKGYEQRHQNGFDCQGLWVEVEVEKELGFKTKRDIEAYGVDRFVEKCKERVRKYAAIQTEQSIRLGQWMDWENSYYTMSDENNYAIWYFLKKCHEKGYLYKGRDSVPWCPRCGTAISQHEILTEQYKEVVHDSIYFRLPIIGRNNEYLLVWTTTPWTLPANIAVAVDEKIDYVLMVGEDGTKFWVAADLPINSGEFDKKVKGKDLIGLKYRFAFDELPRVKEVADKNPQIFHTVVATDERIMPINTQEGTGLVHTAVSAGQEDFQLGKKLGLPMVEVIDQEANYLEGMGEFSGRNAKKHPEIILDYLSSKENYVFKIEKYKHRYPTCWRCKTELVWRVVDEWYISMDGIHANSKFQIPNSKKILQSKSNTQNSLRQQLMEITKKITWIPEFGLDRELDWLKNMHDWLISKKRYWGLSLPIFECECGNVEVIGSKEELKKRAVKGWEAFEGKSPHRPWVDEVMIRCKKCKKAVSRIKDVGNPWLDAGIVPFSTMGYFSDKRYFKRWFPAQIVTESFPGQFKNWFYSLLVMSAVLEKTAPVKTIFGYASVMDERGEEMHKSKGNAIWFDDAVETIGADPIRWFYMGKNPAENANFGYTVTEETKKKLLILYNVYTFFTTYVNKEEFPSAFKITPTHVLDKWVISKLNHVISVATFHLDQYRVAKAITAIEDFFINDLSLWYVRRSRKRFHVDSKDRKEAIETLHYTLVATTKIIAPVIPFFAEAMYHKVRTAKMPESVHLCDWPNKEHRGGTDLELEQKMDEARRIVSLALAERSRLNIKVRQPLAALVVKNVKSLIQSSAELLDIVKEEVNVKEIVFRDTIEKEVELDANITQSLREEGMARELVRVVQGLRKDAGLKPEDIILVRMQGHQSIVSLVQKNQEFFLKEFRAKKVFINEQSRNNNVKEIIIDGKKISLTIKKV